MDARIADARRDLAALVRAYNKDPWPGAVESREIRAILGGANLRDVIALLLELNHQLAAAYDDDAGVSEQDHQAAVDRAMSAIQAAQLAAEASGPDQSPPG